MRPVLYAEDDENDAFFMERAFTKLNLSGGLHIVPNGRKAIHYLAGTEGFSDRSRYPFPDIVLLDVKMPLVTGLEALSWIRTRREFDSLIVVMFTSSTQQADVEFSRNHGANAYLVKPSNADNLAQLVERILHARPAVTYESARLPVEDNML